MRYSILIPLATLTVAVNVFAQGRPADVPAGRPINDLSQRQAPLEPIAPGRQPGWIDQNAVPAGSQLDPQTPAQPAQPVPVQPATPATPTSPDLREQISPSAPEIRSYVANLTNAALSADGFRKASQMLSEDDRQRLQKDLRDEECRAYDELVQRFRNQWKARYGEEFDLAKQRTVMAQYFVLRGPQVDDPITVGGAVPAAQGQAGTPKPNGATGTGAVQSTPERMATMIVPPNAQAQQPAMMLQFRNDGNGKPGNWRLATPQSLTGTRLQENLTHRMEKMLDGQTKWPSDPREAYRLMSYQVLASMADQPPDRPKQDPQRKPTTPDNPSLES